MAIGRAPQNVALRISCFPDRKRHGLELDFEGIVAGPERQGQRKMAKIWRKFGRGAQWLEFALLPGARRQAV
jgi:hypothetical protein